MSGTYCIDGPVQMFDEVSQIVVELCGCGQHVGKMNHSCKAGELDSGGSTGSLELVLAVCLYCKTRLVHMQMNEHAMNQVRARHVPLSTGEDENDVCLWPHAALQDPGRQNRIASLWNSYQRSAIVRGRMRRMVIYSNSSAQQIGLAGLSYVD